MTVPSGTVFESSASPRAASWLRRHSVWIGALTALFAFRLLSGLCYEFFFEDETQIFLIGLRAYAWHHWPYFGPDVVWTKSQIPGALQGLLVAVPMLVAPFPESPFVLLNLLSMAALALMAWCIRVRLPGLPRWLVWGWLMTIPWTVNFSTSMINTSYIMPGAVLFFVGFFEAHPAFTTGRLRRSLAHGMMGAAIAWMMQIHMSWPLLLPYAAAVFVASRGMGWRAALRDAAWFAGGLAVFGSLLVPTFLHSGLGGTHRNIVVHGIGPWVVVTTAARFLAFSSLEVIRFLGTDTPKRVMFLWRHLYLVPLFAIVWIVGIVHPLLMARLALKSQHPERADWSSLRVLVAATIAIVSVAYCFVMEPPQAHAFYIVAPISWLFAAYCWSFLDRPFWRGVAGVVLAVNIAYHLGLALGKAPERSMYKYRAVVAEAVRRRDPDLFAHRRGYAMDAVLPGDVQAWRDPMDEISIGQPVWTIGHGRAILWNLTVQNASTHRAYRDLLYRATYYDSLGRTVLTRSNYILDVVQPGEARLQEINDGAADVPFVRAELEILLAEALEPLSNNVGEAQK
jgi:hypothetical protein